MRENILTIDTVSNELISKMYKELTQPNTKNNNNENKSNIKKLYNSSNHQGNAYSSNNNLPPHI